MKSLILFILFGFSGALSQVSCAQDRSDHALILSLFEQWKIDQVAQGSYSKPEKCNITTVIEEGSDGIDIGIPEDFIISYDDLNNDGKIDALVLFQPKQCDGGGALMNAQERILIMSGPSGYTIDSTMINEIQESLTKGKWAGFFITRAKNGYIYGEYYEYRDSDSSCCPSINRRFSISYTSKEFEFID